MALTERLALVIETAGADRAADSIRRVGDASKGLASTAKQGKLSFGGLADAIGVTKGQLAAGLVGAAAAAGTALLALANKSLDAYAGLAEQVMQVQRVSGATAEDASRLVGVADDLGVSVDSVATGVFNLGRYADRLPSLGVQIARDARGNTNLAETLINVADAYVSTADAAARTQLVQAAFGRSGKDLIPILERGGEGIRDMFAGAEGRGLILSQEDLDTVRTFALVMDDLGDIVQGFMVDIGRELMPVLIDLGVVIQKVADVADGGLGKALKGAFFGVIPGAAVVSKALDLLAGEEGDVRESAMKAKSAFELQEEQFKDMSDAVLATVNADRALVQADRTVQDAHRGLVDAQKDLNKLISEGAVDEEKVADARRSLADATRSLGSANRNLARAQREYDEALAAANLLGGDTQLEALQDASDNLADAKDGVASASEREQEAQADLAKARVGDPEYQDKLADAKERVADQTRRIADAEYAFAQRSLEAIKAHEEEEVALAGKTDEVVRLRGELESLIALYPQLAPLLNPQLAQLPAGPTGGLLSGPATPTAPGNLSPVTTTNNTFNITPAETIDPMNLARTILWNLN